jgi:hypothetical protein
MPSRTFYDGKPRRRLFAPRPVVAVSLPAPAKAVAVADIDAAAWATCRAWSVTGGSRSRADMCALG